MTNRAYAEALELAASDIYNTPLPEIQALLRRAAMKLRHNDHYSFPDEVEESLDDLSAVTRRTRNDTVRFIVRDWLQANGYDEMSARAATIDSPPLTNLTGDRAGGA